MSAADRLTARALRRAALRRAGHRPDRRAVEDLASSWPRASRPSTGSPTCRTCRRRRSSPRRTRRAPRASCARPSRWCWAARSSAGWRSSSATAAPSGSTPTRTPRSCAPTPRATRTPTASARSRWSTATAASARSTPSSSTRCWTRTPPATSRWATPTQMCVDESEADRVNDSTIHVDFMIGSPEVRVHGRSTARRPGASDAWSAALRHGAAASRRHLRASPDRYPRRLPGEVPERLNGHDWKSCVGFTVHRGFESLPLRSDQVRRLRRARDRVRSRASRRRAWRSTRRNVPEGPRVPCCTVVADRGLRARLRAFYGETLGSAVRQEVGETSRPGSSRRGNLTIALMQSEAFGLTFAQSSTAVALQVADVAAARKELEAAGRQRSARDDAADARTRASATRRSSRTPTATRWSCTTATRPRTRRRPACSRPTARRPAAPRRRPARGAVLGQLGDRDHHVVARHGQEVVVGAGAVVADQLDGDVGQRDEVALGRVEHVAHAAAVAVAGQRQRPGDPVPRGLEVHALLAGLHHAPQYRGLRRDRLSGPSVQRTAVPGSPQCRTWIRTPSSGWTRAPRPTRSTAPTATLAKRFHPDRGGADGAR